MSDIKCREYCDEPILKISISPVSVEGKAMYDIRASKIKQDGSEYIADRAGWGVDLQFNCYTKAVYQSKCERSCNFCTKHTDEFVENLRNRKLDEYQAIHKGICYDPARSRKYVSGRCACGANIQDQEEKNIPIKFPAWWNLKTSQQEIEKWTRQTQTTPLKCEDIW